MHNDRTILPEYLIDDPARNEYSCSASDATERLQQLHQEAVAAYREHFGQKLQAKAYHWEAVVNLNAGHTLADVQRLVEAIEKRTGFTAVQVAVHHDEGHVNERGVKQYNHHAHVNFFTLDRQTGQQLYRKSMTKAQKAANPFVKPMNRDRLSELQDLTADVLGMERGKRGSTVRRLDHKAYRVAAQERQQTEKIVEGAERAVGMYRSTVDALEEENARLRRENEELRAELRRVKEIHRQELQDLKAMYEEDRQRLKASGEATQRDYMELKQAYEELKAERSGLRDEPEMSPLFQKMQQGLDARKIIEEEAAKAKDGQSLDDLLKELDEFNEQNDRHRGLSRNR